MKETSRLSDPIFEDVFRNRENFIDDSSNAINSLIEFADFHLLQRSNIEQRVIFSFFLFPMLTLCA